MGRCIRLRWWSVLIAAIALYVMTNPSSCQGTRDLSPYERVKKIMGVQTGAILEHETKLLIRHILYRVKCDEVGVDCLQCLETGSVFKYLNKSVERTIGERSFQTLSMVLVVFMEDVKSECSQSLQLMTAPKLREKLTNNQPTLDLASILKILTQIKKLYRFGTLVLDNIGELVEAQSEVVDFDTDFQCFSPESLYEDLGHPMGSSLGGKDIATFTGLVVVNVLKGKCISLNNNPSPYTFIDDLKTRLANSSRYIFDHEEFENLLEALNIGKSGQSEVYQSIQPQQDSGGSSLDQSESLKEQRLLDSVIQSSMGRCLLRNCYSTDELEKIMEANISALYRQADLRAECQDLVSAILAPFEGPNKGNYSKSVFNTVNNSVINANLSLPEAYGYGTVAITTLSAIPLLVLPLLVRIGSNVKVHILCFLLSLAVSSLTGEAVLHLIRQVIGISQHDGGFLDGLPVNLSLFKMATVLFGFYIFIVLHMIMSLIYGHHKHQEYQVNRSELALAKGHHVCVKEEERNNIALLTIVVIADLVHNFLDGLVVGVSFRSGLSVGVSTALALLPQELTHELGDIAALMFCGLTSKRVSIMVIGSGMTAFLGLLIGVPLASSFGWADWMFAVSAGIFLFVALAHLVPELVRQLRASHHTCITFTFINIGLLLGYSLIVLIVMFEDHIQV